MSAPSFDALRLPEQFGRYRIIRPLGQGGMGAVYLAHDTRLERKVALKVCTLVEDPKALDRFRREARAAAALRHPNLCPLYDYDIHDDVAFITMAFIDGLPLHKWVADHPLLSSGAALLVRKLALAMQAAHDSGVIHRDLKPSNIAMDFRGEPVILDFGLARLMDARTQRTLQGAIFGTPTHMAPEQARGDTDAIGPATDVYALGVILYELLTGELPFVGPLELVLAQVLSASPRPPRKIKPSVPEALERICLKALAKNPADRYESMSAFAAVLDAAVSGVPSTRAKPPTNPRPPTLPTVVTEADRSQATPICPPVAETRPRLPEPPSSGRSWLYIPLFIGLVIAAWIGWDDPSKKADTDPKGKTTPQPAPMLANQPPQPLDSSRSALGEAQVRATQLAWAQYLGVDVERNVDLGSGVMMKMVLVPPGKFRMGATKEEIDGVVQQNPSIPRTTFDNEFPQHDVELTRAFYLGKYPVTQEEFEKITGGFNPSWFHKGSGMSDKVAAFASTGRFPVENLSWYQAVECCNKLSALYGKTPCYRLTNIARFQDADVIQKADVEMPADATGYRLPTEAEWEYACRAGTTTAFNVGVAIDGRDANCAGGYPYGTSQPGPYLQRTAPVDSYKGNALGLFDMHGNVKQWCQDFFDKDYYRVSYPKDPTGPQSGDTRVNRGGWWCGISSCCRAASRGVGQPPFDNSNATGFRLAMTIPARAP